MQKFYDNIDVIKLIEEIGETNYPIKVAALGIQMHMAPRVIKAYDCHCDTENPSNSIIAGCMQSTFFTNKI